MTDLTVMMMGITARRLIISTKGDVLGIDCIIPDERVGLRENDPASCLTFVQVVCITRHELFTIVEHFPAAQQHLAHASLIMTLRGAFKKYFAWHKHDRLQRKMQLAAVGCSAMGGGGGGGGGGGYGNALRIEMAPPDTHRRRRFSRYHTAPAHPPQRTLACACSPAAHTRRSPPPHTL